jgi:hypothetical protein
MEYSGKEETLVPGTLRGYRVWKTNFAGDRLWSTNILNSAWNNDINEAKCAAPGNAYVRDHIAPVHRCACGFYAKYNPFDLKDIVNSVLGGCVSGAVDFHGKIQLGTRGFRAQYAKIVAISIDTWLLNTDDLLHAYGVPVYDSMDSLVKDFPPSDLSELIPTPEQSRNFWWEQLAVAAPSNPSYIEIVTSSNTTTSTNAVGHNTTTSPNWYWNNQWYKYSQFSPQNLPPKFYQT